jgi:hypothetical protein
VAVMAGRGLPGLPPVRHCHTSRPLQVRCASALTGLNPAARNARTLAAFARATCAHTDVPRPPVRGSGGRGQPRSRLPSGWPRRGQTDAPPSPRQAARRRGSAAPLAMRGCARPGSEVRARAGGPGSGATAQNMSILCARRFMRSHSPYAGVSGPDRSPACSWAATQAGSASMKITTCAVNPMTSASRGYGDGKIVTPPSAGGNLSVATSWSKAASGPPGS